MWISVCGFLDRPRPLHAWAPVTGRSRRAIRPPVPYSCSTPYRRVCHTERRGYDGILTRRSMYNLPPPSGNNNNNNNQKGDDLQAILVSVLTVGGVVAFFASPLGAIFFAVFNSLVLLAILLPVLGIVGFNLWQYWNTMEAPCPNCGAPARVLKNTGVAPNPSLCLNCGSLVAANVANDGIDAVGNSVNPNDGMVDATSLLDTLFGGTGGLLDTTTTTTTTTTTESTDQRAKKYQREQTVIDVEVEEEDEEQERNSKWRPKPFQ
jgi:hypothetical protein